MTERKEGVNMCVCVCVPVCDHECEWVRLCVSVHICVCSHRYANGSFNFLHNSLEDNLTFSWRMCQTSTTRLQQKNNWSLLVEIPLSTKLSSNKKIVPFSKNKRISKLLRWLQMQQSKFMFEVFDIFHTS